MSKKRFLKAIMLFVMVLSLQVAHAQLKTVTGTIKDDKGAPVSGATVKADGSTEATKTADDGSFSLDVQPTTTMLVISSVGFAEQKVSVDNASAVVIKHKPTELEDVTVNSVNIGYGFQKRRDVTGSISSIKGAEIKDLPTQNVAAALEGRIAGVDVTNSSSEPGKQAQITIRGVSSLFQANPLYVIDGIIQRGNPVSDNGPDIGNNINPADIASIDVLKDAAATAIYGAAAAGGVIIITTKKGSGTKPTVNFSSRYGVTKPELIHLLGTPDFIKFKDDIKDPAYINNTETDTFPNTDWVKAMFRNGIEQNYSLSLSGVAGPVGVAPTVNYYMSGVYNDQKGVFLNNSSELYGFKLNSDFKITNHIKAGETIDAYQRNTTPVDYDLDPASPVNDKRLNAPFLTVPDMHIFGSSPGTYGANPPGFSGGNPIAQILSKDRNITQDNIAANVYGEVKLPLSLTFRATLGYTIFNEQGNSYEAPYIAGNDQVANTRLFKSFVSYKSLLNAYTLAHDKSYGNHNLNVLIGYEQYQGTYNALYTNEVNVIPAKFSYFPQSNSITANSISTGGYDPYPLVESEFGRINYNYNHRYFLSASIRRDADYLKFGPGNQAGIFPAASVGWIISDESFFKKALPKINFIKIRASYGSVGNSGNGSLPPYIFLAGYSPTASQGFAPGASPLLTYTQNRIANNDIKWETTTETNIGIDGEALHSKLFFTVEWYSKSTKDLLYKLPLPASSGFPYYYANIGSVVNKGVDILLGYKDHVSEVNYTLTFTGSFNKNKVLDLNGINNNPVFDGSTDLGPKGSQGKWTGDGLTYTAPGHPFGQFWGLRAEGIFKTNAEAAAAGYTVNGNTPKAGDLKYWDKNGDHQITNADDTVIGNPYPKFTYGFKANFDWKGFDLAILFHGVMGVDILNGTAAYTESYFNDGNTTTKIFGASYFGTNGLTSQPRVGVVNGTSFTQDPNGNYTHPSSYFVENGSYLKIQNIQLGYTFSNKILQKVAIKSARLYVMGNNILTITKYSGLDPELGSQDLGTNGGTTNRGIDSPYKYPAAKTYTVGLDINF